MLHLFYTDGLENLGIRKFIPWCFSTTCPIFQLHSSECVLMAVIKHEEEGGLLTEILILWLIQLWVVGTKRKHHSSAAMS